MPGPFAIRAPRGREPCWEQGAPESSSPSGTSDGGQVAESLLAGIERAAHRAQAPGEEEVRDLRGSKRSSFAKASADLLSSMLPDTAVVFLLIRHSSKSDGGSSAPSASRAAAIVRAG